ncbi:CD109 antigen-like [Oscarella lobularis]|uniref:CD109 antigen-like n=1 Tax=Oscarella lobularis TaxID=121494 RepID=UPI003313104C
MPAFVVLLSILVAVVTAKHSYLIVAPKTVRPGLPVRVAVRIFEAQSSVTVNVTLAATNGVHSPLASASVAVDSNSDATVDIQMPARFPSTDGAYALNVTGSGGLTFDDGVMVTVDSKCLSLFVQTDKGIYNPGETVRMRLIGYDRDLKPFTGKVDVQIMDPNSNLMANWLDVEVDGGIALRDFPLATEPPLGTWKIEVKGNCIDQSQQFKVVKYVLPRFEVSINSRSYIVATDEFVSGSLSAEYTYGLPVKGSAILTFYLPEEFYPDKQSSDFQYPSFSITLPNFDGDYAFTVSRTNLISLRAPNDRRGLPTYGQLAINASVSEETTGTTFHHQALANFYADPVVLKFHDSTPSTYKPGLAFPARIVVTYRDNTPVTDSEVDVSIRTSATSTPETTTHAVRNGIADILANVPSDANHFHITVSYQDETMNRPVTASTFPAQAESPRKSYIQLRSSSTASAKAGLTADFLVSATFPMTDLYYMVLSRGNLVSQSTYNLSSSASETTLSIAMTADMAPLARLVVYAIRIDEVVVDSLTISVDGLFKNIVTLSLSEVEARPADDVSLQVTASPNSYVGLLAADQSVTLLAKGNDITQSSVNDEVDSYVTRRQSVDAKDALKVFYNAGLAAMSDANIYSDGARVSPTTVVVTASLDLERLTSNEIEELVAPDRVRTFFPQTWIWANATTDDSGTATLSQIVPDTITTWIVSAFAMNEQAGLGVPSSTTSLRSFKPFFVSLDLPYSVIRGEQLALKVVVFNYLPTDLSVRITLEAKSGLLGVFDDFQSELEAASNPGFVITDSVTVASNDLSTVNIAVAPTRIGRIAIKVTAQSSSAADAIEKQLLVEPEGRKIEYTRNVFIRLDNAVNSVQEDVLLDVPGDAIKNSSRGTVTVVGDLLGPTLNNLEMMVQLPTGCGEQNAALFAPNIYVRNYLVAIGKLTDELKQKTDRFMMTGYQRQLNYKHQDGSYSVWGQRDSSGSLWLTAFVVKLYAQSSQYVAIDSNQMTTSLTWIVSQQESDGHFDEVGTIFDRGLLGGLEGDVARTAFVLISLVEAKNAMTLPTPDGVDTAITSAKSYLERQLTKLTDGYSVPITAYALILADSAKASDAKTKLMTAAITKNGATHWTNSDETIDDSNDILYYPHHAPAADIEMTGYALLALTKLQDVSQSLPVARWLSQQRNSLGGWSSTQDTVIALQAMASYARLTHSDGQDLTVKLTSSTNSSFTHTFAVSDLNSFVLQQVENVPVGGTLGVMVSGNGAALLQASVSYNVNDREPTEPAYDFTVQVVASDDGSTLTIEMCSTYKLNKDSGMVVVSGTLPSGFVADEDKLDQFFEDPSLGVQRYDVNDNGRIDLYLNEISTGETKCLDIFAVRQYDVGSLQPVKAEVYSYYEPEFEKVSHLYVPTGLADLHVCDLCKCHTSCNGCDGYSLTRPCPTSRTSAAGTVSASILSVIFSLFLILFALDSLKP